MAHDQEGPARPPELEAAPGLDPGRGLGLSFGPRGLGWPLLAMNQDPNIMPRINWKGHELDDKAINYTRVISISRGLYQSAN